MKKSNICTLYREGENMNFCIRTVKGAKTWTIFKLIKDASFKSQLSISCLSTSKLLIY